MWSGFEPQSPGWEATTLCTRPLSSLSLNEVCCKTNSSELSSVSFHILFHFSIHNCSNRKLQHVYIFLWVSLEILFYNICFLVLLEIRFYYISLHLIWLFLFLIFLSKQMLVHLSRDGFILHRFILDKTQSWTHSWSFTKLVPCGHSFGKRSLMWAIKTILNRVH